MKVNDYDVVERSNRPNTSQRVGLRVLFINDGLYQDPYEISSVGVFLAQANLSPCSILTSANEVSAMPLMGFGNSATLVANSSFNASNYSPGTTASGIYKTGTGQFVVVLDGTVNLSGGYFGSAMANQASAATNYIDVWTVRMSQGSNYQVFINSFKLFDDTFIALTEPLLLKTSHHLSPKHIKLGSQIDLKMTTDVAVENRNIDRNIINLFKDSLLINPQIQIVKINEIGDNVLPSRVTVSSFAQTSSTCSVTSENTILFTWDTSELSTHSELLAGNLGSLVGLYTVQAKYTLLNNVILTPLFNVIVN